MNFDIFRRATSVLQTFSILLPCENFKSRECIWLWLEQTSRAGILLQRVVALFAMALMISVWPIWWTGPQSRVQVPWFSVLCKSPVWVDGIALCGVACGLAVMVSGRGSYQVQQLGRLLFTLALLVLTALDQQRFQPWVCQFLLFGTLMWIAPNHWGRHGWRVVIASIYLWSAVSKLDAAFLTSHGQLLLSGMLNPLGIETTYWSPRSRIILVALFPLGELLTGILLLRRQTYRYGLPLSLLMHLLLIWILGAGLQHEWSVLIWNLFFIIQNIILFGPECSARATIPTKETDPSCTLPRRRLALGFTLLAATYPALETIGYCDHWPAWAVYSSRPALVRVFIDEVAAEKLPSELKKFLRTPAPLESRIPFSLDAWAFATCRCPAYPQLRYRLALARGLLSQHLPENAIEIEIAFTPDRWTGERRRLLLYGMDEVNAYCQRFLFNTDARGGKRLRGKKIEIRGQETD